MVAISDNKTSATDIRLSGAETVKDVVKESDRSTNAVISDLNARFPNDAPAPKTEAKEPAGIAAVKEALETHAAGVPVSKEENKNRKATGGEVMFDRVVYTGIGFGVNEASALWITDQFMHGKPKSWLGGKAFSKEGFEAASAWIAKKFNISHDKVSNALLMATLMLSGTLLVLPMRYLEENKIFWVKHCNHFLDYIKGNKASSEEVAARDADAEQAIACSPQQTWAALLGARVAAMASVFVVGNYIVKKSGNDKIMDFSEKHVTNAAKAIGYKNADKNDTFKRYARLFGVETYACAISSVVLEFASKFLAKRGTEVHDPEVCDKNHPKTETTSVPADTSSSSEATNTKRRADQFKKAPLSVAKANVPSRYTDKIHSEKETPAVPTM